MADYRGDIADADDPREVAEACEVLQNETAFRGDLRRAIRGVLDDYAGDQFADETLSKLTERMEQDAKGGLFFARNSLLSGEDLGLEDGDPVFLVQKNSPGQIHVYHVNGPVRGESTRVWLRGQRIIDYEGETVDGATLPARTDARAGHIKYHDRHFLDRDAALEKARNLHESAQEGDE